MEPKIKAIRIATLAAGFVSLLYGLIARDPIAVWIAVFVIGFWSAIKICGDGE